MRRREFLKLAAIAVVSTAVPMVAFASGKPKPVEAITFDQIEEVCRMFEAAAVPEPYHAMVNPKTIWSVNHFDGVGECDEIMK